MKLEVNACKQHMQNIIDYVQGLKVNFIERGRDEIKNLGFGGSIQPQVNATSDVIADNLNDVVKEVLVVSENVGKIICEMTQWDESDFLGGVRSAAQNAQSIGTVVEEREPIFP